MTATSVQATARGLTVIVHGKPAPQGSKRHVGRGVMVENCKRVKPWREDVSAAAEAAIDEWEQRRPLPAGVGRRWEPITGPVEVTVTFRFARPAGHYGTGRNALTIRPSAPAHPTGGKGDIEKLVRAVHDALTAAGVWRDDAQVVRLNAAKVWCQEGERPGATIVVREVG
jgi:crossover junction endodeoxyribonuclease RusA